MFPPDWVLHDRTYQNWSFPVKINALIAIGFLYRIKFYAAWYITQAAVNYTGISDDGKGKFDQVITGSIMFEFNSNPKTRTEYWNTSIQKWLKEVIFEPINGRLKSPEISTYVTFIASAMWHGVYMTYHFGTIFFDPFFRLYPVGNSDSPDQMDLQMVDGPAKVVFF